MFLIFSSFFFAPIKTKINCFFKHHIDIIYSYNIVISYMIILPPSCRARYFSRLHSPSFAASFVYISAKRSRNIRGFFRVFLRLSAKRSRNITDFFFSYGKKTPRPYAGTLLATRGGQYYHVSYYDII